MYILSSQVPRLRSPKSSRGIRASVGYSVSTCDLSELIILHSVAPAIASSYTRAGVVINFVTATGGDVEMLRSIECFYK